MTASRARVSLLAVALLSSSAAGRLAADRIAYQGRIGAGPRNIIIMSDTGLHPIPLGEVPGAADDKMTPSLSPDGKMLAFAARVGDNYDIFSWELDKYGNTVGEPKHLTTSKANEEQPVWSPDGKQIAYVYADPPEFALYVMNADGSVQRKVADLTKNYRIASPTWSPDSKEIAYSKDGTLWVAPLEGGQPKQIADDGWYPAWSPDGKYIAAWVRQPATGLVLYTPDGKLYNTLIRFVNQFGQIAWSSDGKEMVFSAGAVGEKRGALWTIPVGGNKAEPLRHYGQVHGYLSRARSPEVMVAEAPAQPTPAVAPAQAKPAAVPAQPKPAAAPGQAKPAATPAKPTQTIRVVRPQTPLPALPGPEGPVRMVSPAEGAVLRGQPTVVAAKNADEGYVLFEVNGDFRWATAAPYQWQWDTRLLPDGDYTLTAIGYDAAGQREGRSETKVRVENGLPQSALGEQGTLLRLRLNPQEVWHKKIHATSSFTGPAPDEYRRFTGTLDAEITQTLESVTRDGTSATVVTRVDNASLTLGGVATPLAEGLHPARVTVTPLDKIVPPVAVISPYRISLGELYTTLPQQRVKVGDSWTAPMTYIAELVNRQLQQVAAHSQVSELKWQDELEAAHIVSTVTWPQLPLAEGLQLTNVSIRRDTWFAFKQGKILRTEDTISARLAGTPPAATAGTAVRPMSAPLDGSSGLHERLFQQQERRRGFGGRIQIRPPSGVVPGAPIPTGPPTTTAPTRPAGPTVPPLTYTFTLVSELMD